MTSILRGISVVVFSLTAMAGPSLAATATRLATGLYQSLYGITTDGTKLYITGSTGLLRDFTNNPANGVVGSIPIAGGALTTIYSNTKYATSSGHVAPFQIARTGPGKFVWADPDAGSSTGAAFISGTSAGAAPSQFFNICCGPGVLPGDGVGVAYQGGHIYFSDGTGGRIGVDPSGGSATQLGPTRYPPDFNTEAWSQIAVANGKVFIADSAQLRGAGSGADAGKEVIVDKSASLSPGVRWISTDGLSGFQDLSVGKIPNPRGIVAVGQFVYVTSAHAVWRVNQTTGATTRVISGARFQDLMGITYSNGALYVADSQTVFGPFVSGVAAATSDTPGVIWKITLP